MNISDVLNGNVLFISVISGLIFIISIAIAFLVKSWKRALELGYTKDSLKKVIKSSSIFSIVPSLSIVIALFSLASVLGIPWSWFRLSVVGSLTYELMAAEMAVSGIGYNSLSQFLSSGDISAIGTMMFVMSISIVGGITFNMFFGKKVQASMLNFQSKNEEWGNLAMSYFTLAIAIVFLPIQLTNGPIHMATLFTSAAIAYIHLILIKKFNIKWLSEFILANSLILGMISSVFWNNLLN